MDSDQVLAPIEEKTSQQKPKKEEKELAVILTPQLYNLDSLLLIREPGFHTIQILYDKRVYSFEIEVFYKQEERNSMNRSKILFYKSKHDSCIKETVLSLWGLRKGTVEMINMITFLIVTKETPDL